jgi:hypothetical protein
MTSLERKLGPFDAAAIVVSKVIGGGIFFVPILVARLTGDGARCSRPGCSCSTPRAGSSARSARGAIRDGGDLRCGVHGDGGERAVAESADVSRRRCDHRGWTARVRMDGVP